MEEFYSIKELTGQAITPYLVFARKGDGCHFIGSLEVGMMKVLSLDKQAKCRLAAYTRTAPGEGVFTIYTNDGSRFIALTSQRISDEKRQSRGYAAMSEIFVD